jgi:hypothetical protein
MLLVASLKVDQMTEVAEAVEHLALKSESTEAVDEVHLLRTLLTTNEKHRKVG